MTRSTVTHETIVIERSYDASVTDVFRAWADPERKARWLAGSADALGTSYELDFRVGGKEINRSGPPGGPTYTYTAEIRDIVVDERIVLTTEMLKDGTRISITLVTAEFHGSERTARLVFTEQGVFLDGHETPTQREHGMNVLFDSLATLLNASEYSERVQ